MSLFILDEQVLVVFSTNAHARLASKPGFAQPQANTLIKRAKA